MQHFSKTPSINEDGAESPSLPKHDNASERQDRIQDRAHVLINFLFLTLPMLLVSAALLTVVFYFRVKHDTPYPDLQLINDESMNRSDVIYVDLSATTLAFIASRASSLVGIMSASVMALASCPIASRHVRATHTSRRQDMPMPFELALTVGVLTGSGFGSFWAWIKHTKNPKTRKQTQARALTSAISLLFLSFILGYFTSTYLTDLGDQLTAYSFLVLAADTWLHLTTKSVSLDLVQTIPADAIPSYGFGLTGNCTTNYNNSLSVQGSDDIVDYCSLIIVRTGNFVMNPSVSLGVFANTSDTMVVQAYELGSVAEAPQSEISQSTSNVVAYMFPRSAEDSVIDFTASTFGVSTQCAAIQSLCKVDTTADASASYDCSPAFKGDLVQKSWNMAYFVDANLTNDATDGGVQTPYYFAVASYLGSDIDSIDTPTDSQLIYPMHGGRAFILRCNSTVYDLQYDFVNRTVINFQRVISNESTTNAVQVTISGTSFATPYLQQTALYAMTSNTSQQIADQYALAYSKAAVTMMAGFLETRPVAKAQQRRASIVTKVPVTPLFALIVANMLFVALGIILACIAMWACPNDVRELQARLSIAGIVADRFEGQRARTSVSTVTELFAENKGQESVRVGIARTEEGGYAYEAWPAVEKP